MDPSYDLNGYDTYMNCYYYSSSTGQTNPGNVVMTFRKAGTVKIVWGNGSYNWADSGPV